MPKTAAFTGFTRTGGNSSTTSDFNVSGSFNKGFNFYTNGWNTGSTFFIEALGYRDSYLTGSKASIYYYGTAGRMWTVGAYNDVAGACLGFDTDTMHVQGGYIRSFGFPCFMVKE